MVDHDRGNPYDDPARAASYAGLEFPGTYYLAYRDLPDLIARHAGGVRAQLDEFAGHGGTEAPQADDENGFALSQRWVSLPGSCRAGVARA